MYDLRVILKRLKFPISPTFAGQVIQITNNLNKEGVFITIAVRRFNLQFVVVIGPGTFIQVYSIQSKKNIAFYQSTATTVTFRSDLRMTSLPFSGLDCKTDGFFLKISKEISKAWREAPESCVWGERKKKRLSVFHTMSSFRPGGSKMSSSCQKSVHNSALLVNLIHSVIDFEGE